MSSRQYSQLVQRFRELRKYFLPVRFDPTGTYPDRIHERAKAFRLLLHAEFETYIEDRAVDVALDRFDAYKLSRKVSRCVVSLVAYHERGQAGSVPTPISGAPVKGRPAPLLLERVESAKNAYVYHVRRQNNGVKEANLLHLLMPLGMESHEFDLVWLASIDSWATQRGQFAHQSASKIATRADPKDELRIARMLLAGFKLVDAQLDKL